MLGGGGNRVSAKMLSRLRPEGSDMGVQDYAILSRGVWKALETRKTRQESNLGMGCCTRKEVNTKDDVLFRYYDACTLKTPYIMQT